MGAAAPAAERCSCTATGAADHVSALMHLTWLFHMASPYCHQNHLLGLPLSYCIMNTANSGLQRYTEKTVIP